MVLEHHRRPLVGGGEGDHLLGLPAVPLLEAPGQSLGGVVVGIHHLVVGTQHSLHLLGRGLGVQAHQLLHRHVRLGDGARLIHAQYIHPGQGLNGAHLVDQGFPLGQAHHRDGQGHAGQEVQALGNHADEGGHHGGDGGGEALLLYQKFVAKQGDAQGNEGEADDPNQAVQGLHHLGLARPLVRLGLMGQTGSVAGRSHLVHPGPALARHHKAAGEQRVPGIFHDGVRLAGDEGLVHRHLAH